MKLKKHHLSVLIVAILFGVAGVFAYRELQEPQKPAANGVSPAGIDVASVLATSLPDLEGRSQALAQWQGKVMVINFWAPWCPPCREEIPGFLKLQEKYGDKGLVFVGIALDELDRVQSYVDEIGIHYPILIGGPEAGQLSSAAGNRLGGLPYTLVLDREGKPVAHYTGAVAEHTLEELVKPLL
ncbi:MAG: TlpA disulfide reductase family protein [Pseudomonadota bacterium]